jgi:hypothetical protein
MSDPNLLLTKRLKNRHLEKEKDEEVEKTTRGKMKEYKESKGARYEHGEDKPSQPKQGTLEKGMGCYDFKAEAMDISYGQAGKEGCKADNGKIESQMKNYHWAE